MIVTLLEERAREAAWRERVAASLELIADRLAGPEKELVTRVATLEDLLKEFVVIMENPNSANEEWVELLGHVRVALGLDADV